MIRSYLSGCADAGCVVPEVPEPAVPPGCPAGLEKAAPAIDDPEPYIPDSFDDVVRVYDLGWITDPDYEALAVAVVS